MAIYGQFQMPFGPVAAALNNAGRLMRLVFLDGQAPGKEQCNGEDRNDVVFSEVKTQIDDFFHGRRTKFDLGLAPPGTDFQQNVWAALTTIPIGETRTYGELARALGIPGGARAVGRANATNPIALIIPCHRVIGANGSLTGYAGGLDIKRQLLAFEQSQKSNLKQADLAEETGWQSIVSAILTSTASANSTRAR